MRWGLMWLLATVLMVPACTADAGEVEASTNDELAERQAIFDQVKAALDSRDYAALNKMATEYRTRRARTPSGTWKLAYFYYGVTGHMPVEDDKAACRKADGRILDEWIAADPKQPAPYIAKAWLTRSYGGCLRGRGFANQTSPAAMQAYLTQAAQAQDLLETHRDVASVDPQYYAEMENIYRARGRSNEAFQALIDEASEREPYYYGTYFAAAQYYLPQWGGTFGDIDRIARYAADKTATNDGDGAYVRVFWSLEDRNCFKKDQVDWPLMKASMEDVAAQYPNDWNFGNFARISCRFGDGKTAATYFDKMTDDRGAQWQDMGEWEACHALAVQARRQG